MKRRIWILSFLICIIVFSLSGCDWEFPVFPTPTPTVEPTPSPTPTPIPTATPVPTPTPTPIPTATPVPTPTPTPTPIDWSKEYDDYFQKEQLLPENYRVETSVIVEEVEAKVSLAQTETFCQLDLGLGKTNIYIFSNGTMAFFGKKDKNGEEWFYTRLEDGKTLEEVVGIDISMDLGISGDIVIGQVYQGNVVEEEKIYDIIDIVTSQNYGKIKVRLYINRDTQEIERLQTQYDGQEIVGYIYEIAPLELPAGSAHAKRQTFEEFSEKYKKAILQGVASAIGGKLWN